MHAADSVPAVPRPSRTPNVPAPPRLEGDADELAADDLGPGAALERGRLRDADLTGARLRGLRLLDVRVERGNLANTAAPELTLRRVAITGARLTGAQWTAGTIADATFRDCRIDLATFAGTTFERVAFAGCLLAQADFRDALLRSVRFEGCDLTEADLAGVRIDRCELHGCTLDGLGGVERLRGAAMPWPDVVGNAALFASALGIRVLDRDDSSDRR
jgi:uncharacterized protein YjbI with pentapeptide repeats